MSTTNTTPSWSALKRKDLRRSRRYTVDGATVRVSWLGLSGTLQVIHNARVLNISEEGMAFELPEPARMHRLDDDQPPDRVELEP